VHFSRRSDPSYVFFGPAPLGLDSLGYKVKPTANRRNPVPPRGLLSLPDSKTGKRAIVLNAPAMAVLAGLQRIGAYVIAGQDAVTDKEKPRADLNKP
jgi:hypothetical protein